MTNLRLTSSAPALALVVSVALFLGSITAAGAQDPAPDTTVEGQLAVIDAHIEGSGPWTSWFGAAPDRELVFTVVNIGSDALDDPELILTFGKGPNPTGSVPAPELGRLAPGEPATFRVDLDLPRFAVGTYAVEGSFPNLATPIGFRAETSHIPWLALALPLLILIQLFLVFVRNRARDRIHRPPPGTSDPTLPDRASGPPTTSAPPATKTVDLADETAPPVSDLEPIISEELGVVFDDAFSKRDESIDDGELRDLVIDLAGTAAGRVAARAELTDAEQASLHMEMTEAVLAAFDLAPVSPV